VVIGSRALTQNIGSARRGTAFLRVHRNSGITPKADRPQNSGTCSSWEFVHELGEFIHADDCPTRESGNPAAVVPRFSPSEHP
jgi:hypothetical protein